MTIKSTLASCIDTKKERGRMPRKKESVCTVPGELYRVIPAFPPILKAQFQRKPISAPRVPASRTLIRIGANKKAFFVQFRVINDDLRLHDGLAVALDRFKCGGSSGKIGLCAGTSS
jgi:hypothetical protein